MGFITTEIEYFHDIYFANPSHYYICFSCGWDCPVGTCG